MFTACLDQFVIHEVSQSFSSSTNISIPVFNFIYCCGGWGLNSPTERKAVIQLLNPPPLAKNYTNFEIMVYISNVKHQHKQPLLKVFPIHYGPIIM